MPVTDDHIDAVVEWVLESRDQPMPPQAEQAVREGLEALALRDHLPLHHQLVVDALGYEGGTAPALPECAESSAR